ncbi:MAG TPA: hypothetical protein VFK05_11045 [Polyangiaceae bacterium]|nr:hypothetical protein [Polyangiaceae bacterium]
MSRPYRIGYLLVAVLMSGCSGAAVESESVAAQDQGLTAVPTPAASVTFVDPECTREWIVEAPGDYCPAVSKLEWRYDPVNRPLPGEKLYCAYVSLLPSGNRNGPVPGGVQAPLRSDCVYAAAAQLPRAAPLPSSACSLTGTCNLPHQGFAPYRGGPPIYFNGISRTLWAIPKIARVRLYPLTSLTGASGVLPVAAGFIQFETPGGGFYRLTDAPREVGRMDYMLETEGESEDEQVWITAPQTT